jgi:hypothetical protein
VALSQPKLKTSMMCKGYPAMQKPSTDKNIIRDQLKAKRNLLFDQYCQSPQSTRLAIEIRLIDDQVAELIQHMGQQAAKAKSGKS